MTTHISRMRLLPARVCGKALATLAALGASAACQPPDTNTPPIADAGPDLLSYVQQEVDGSGRQVDVFETLELDGSRSHDPDGDYLSRYFWAFDVVPIGSEVSLEALSTNAQDLPTTTFTPDREGTYGLTLQVFDGQKVSLLDYVQVIVARKNGVPIADAGTDLDGRVGSSATFDGSSSLDPDGDFLSYQWDLVVIPPDSTLTALSLGSPATARPTLVPDVQGVYTLALEVSDGQASSAPSFVTLTVGSGNLAPVAVVPSSTVVTPCFENPVTLDGGASYDPEGGPLTFHWSVLEVPYGSSVGQESLSASSAPSTQVPLDRYGLYVFLLSLEDDMSAATTASVALLFDDGSTQEPPVADPGGNRTVPGEVSCTDQGCPACTLSAELDGSRSSDPNGDPLEYAWEVLAGGATLEPPDQAQTLLTAPPLIPPAAGRSTTLNVRVQLEVADCFGTSVPVERTVTFTCEGL